MANTRQRDLEDLRESAEMERQMLRRQAKQEVEKARSETSVLRQENLMLQEDVQNMKGRRLSYDVIYRTFCRALPHNRICFLFGASPLPP